MSDNTVMREGGCFCGQFRFRCEDKGKLHINHCSCRDCQKSSAGGTATLVVVPAAQFHILQGELRSFSVRSESGQSVERSFCPNCGSPVCGKPGRFPELIMVRASCFDADDWMKPSVHFWTESRPAWADIPADLPSYPGNPPA